MDDLLYTHADRPRVSPVRILLAVVMPAATIAVALSAAGFRVVGLAFGGALAALVLLLRLSFRRAWVKADASGISYRSLGGLRVRRVAWQEIGGVQIHRANTQLGTVRNVRLLLRTGRRRTLPLLIDNYTYPDPDLDRKVAAIRALADHYGATPPERQPSATPIPTPIPVPLSVEAPWSRRNASFRRWMWRYLVPACVLLVLGFGSIDVGPAWSAHLGHGTRGTFTTTSADNGTFVSDDGTDVRYDVSLSGGGPTEIGARVPALDTGDRIDVYPIGGGDDWLWTTAMLLLAVAVAGGWFRSVLLRVRRTRRAAARRFDSGPADT